MAPKDPPPAERWLPAEKAAGRAHSGGGGDGGGGDGGETRLTSIRKPAAVFRAAGPGAGWQRRSGSLKALDRACQDPGPERGWRGYGRAGPEKRARTGRYGQKSTDRRVRNNGYRDRTRIGRAGSTLAGCWLSVGWVLKECWPIARSMLPALLPGQPIGLCPYPLPVSSACGPVFGPLLTPPSAQIWHPSLAPKSRAQILDSCPAACGGDCVCIPATASVYSGVDARVRPRARCQDRDTPRTGACPRSGYDPGATVPWPLRLRR